MTYNPVIHTSASINTIWRGFPSGVVGHLPYPRIAQNVPLLGKTHTGVSGDSARACDEPTMGCGGTSRGARSGGVTERRGSKFLQPANAPACACDRESERRKRRRRGVKGWQALRESPREQRGERIYPPAWHPGTNINAEYNFSPPFLVNQGSKPGKRGGGEMALTHHPTNRRC